MPRTSKIRRLPKELKAQLHAMMDAGHTLSELTAHLKKLGADLSRSGLGRYTQQVEKVAARLRQSREAADAIVARLGEGVDEGRMGRMLTQMVQTLAFDYINRRVDDPEAQLDLNEIYQVARTVRQATLAGRAGQDHELKTRGELREESIQSGDIVVSFEDGEAAQ